MSFYPLVHILFWIAMISSPQGASQITITGPDKNWTWTKQESGWSQSVDHSVWIIEGNTVISKSGEKTDKQDVSEFVKGIKEQDWNKSASLKLRPMTSLTKAGNAFVYTQNEGDPTEERFVIKFK
jgi:hypothetical protein